MSEYAVGGGLVGFERSWAGFAALLAVGADPVSGPRTADELEGYLLEQGRRVQRQVLQDRLDQLAAAERRATGPVVDAGEGNRKRMAEVAAVYDAEPAPPHGGASPGPHQ